MVEVEVPKSMPIALKEPCGGDSVCAGVGFDGCKPPSTVVPPAPTDGATA